VSPRPTPRRTKHAVRSTRDSSGFSTDSRCRPSTCAVFVAITAGGVPGTVSMNKGPFALGIGSSYFAAAIPHEHDRRSPSPHQHESCSSFPREFRRSVDEVQRTRGVWEPNRARRRSEYHRRPGPIAVSDAYRGAVPDAKSTSSLKVTPSPALSAVSARLRLWTRA